MIKEKRLEQIAEYITEKKYATIRELSDYMEVSTATIRRDIETLVERKKIALTTGGVTIFVPEENYSENPYHEKACTNIDEKARIARAAMKFIKPGQTILLDSGTTTYQLVPYLKEIQNINLVTNDVKIASDLTDAPGISVTILGGYLRSGFYSTMGYYAEKLTTQISADISIVGIDSISISHGLMIANQDELGIKRRIIESGKHVIVLCDHTKFSTSAFLNVCPINKVDTIITGTETDPWIVKAVKNLGADVILAGEAPE